jgi:hypothetical protein
VISMTMSSGEAMHHPSVEPPILATSYGAGFCRKLSSQWMS